MTLKSVLSLAALALGALGMDDHEHIVVGKTFMAGGLDSRSGSTGWSLTSHGIAENLFTVDKHGEIVPLVAASTTKVSDLVWDVRSIRRISASFIACSCLGHKICTHIFCSGLHFNHRMRFMVRDRSCHA
jgi:hypothetical protein